jgi:hypothetical protein
MSSSTPSSTLIKGKVSEVLEEVSKKIAEEIEQLYKAFKESEEDIVGKLLIDVNKLSTKYCYAADIALIKYPEIKVGLRIACELYFEIYDSEVEDRSDIRYRKEQLIQYLRNLLKL